MGTRNLTVVIQDGTHKIAQYGQWDGYPSGQGATALSFLRDGGADKLAAVLPRVRFLTEEEYDAKTQTITGGAQFINMEQSAQIDAVFPFLSRDHGAAIITALTDAPEDADLAVFDQYDFGQDGLFCEYAYVIDLDAGRFEAYVGFQHEDHADGRWAGTATSADFTPKYEGQSFYAPVRLAASWPLDALPEFEEFERIISGVEVGYRPAEEQEDPEDEDYIAPIPGPFIA